MIEKKQNILTKEGFNKLKDELKKLIEIERPEVIEEIKEARSQGDLSENAEFDVARERQGQIEDRIKRIEKIIQNSKVLHSSTSNKSIVRIGSKVTIKNLETNKKETYKIVGTLEADPLNNKISNEAPLAKAILGLEQNKTVKINSKIKYDIKIIDIQN